MANIKIAVINKSTVVKNDSQLVKVVAALQKQVSRDFAPAWGIDADLRLVAPNSKPAANEWWLVILDNSDQAGALGYHDITSKGLPLGKVFAKTDLTYGEDWACTASHELLEMLADPTINLTVFEENTANGGVLYAYEVCDACEDEKFAYKIDGVLVSDFVYPAWFESFRKTGQFDFMKKISKPLQLLSGGYIGMYNIKNGGGWTQKTPEKVNMRSRAAVGSRRERRTVPLHQRILSTANKQK